MLQPQEKRPEVIFARVTKANKEYLREKAKECQMEEGPFLNLVLTNLRVTPEGIRMMAVGEGDEVPTQETNHGPVPVPPKKSKKAKKPSKKKVKKSASKKRPVSKKR